MKKNIRTTYLLNLLCSVLSLNLPQLTSPLPQPQISPKVPKLLLSNFGRRQFWKGRGGTHVGD